MKKAIGISILSIGFLIGLFVSVAIDTTTNASAGIIDSEQGTNGPLLHKSSPTVITVPQGVQGIQGQQLQKSFPAMIKASPSMISSIPKYPNLPPEFNAAMSELDKVYKNLKETFVPQFSEGYDKWTKKWDECVNKAYTYDDQKSVCLPNDSAETCIGKLVRKCSDGAAWDIAVRYDSLDGYITNLKNEHDAMKSSLKKLGDYMKCLRTQWPQQTCQ